MICEVCNTYHKNIRLLAAHIGKYHKDINPIEYTIKYFYNDIEPKCMCGCNGNAPYRYMGRFMTYITGHNSFVANPFKGKKQTVETIQKILSTEGYKNRAMKGKFQPKPSEETKLKMSMSHKGQKYSKESIKNYRLAAIKRISRNKFAGGQVVPSYNPNGCKIIDEYGKNNGYKFQHALNGGEYHIVELGYWVDGYDKNKNVVVEIDENHHYDIHGNLKEKDLIRQQEITNFLKCNFIRIKI